MAEVGMEAGRRSRAAGAVAAGWVALAALALWTWQGLGFPDGHLTALDRARAWLLPGVALAASVGAGGSLTVGARAPGRSALALLGAAGLWALAEAALAARLDHGGGG